MKGGKLHATSLHGDFRETANDNNDTSKELNSNTVNSTKACSRVMEGKCVSAPSLFQSGYTIGTPRCRGTSACFVR